MQILAVLVLALGLVLGGLYAFQERLVFFPDRELEADPASVGLAFDEVRALTRDMVQIHGWFVPAEPERAVVLFCHGNAGNISHRLETLRLLHSLGLSVCIFDYRGYGKSRGRPTERGVYLDARAMWDMLGNQKGAQPGRVILWGRSLGAAVASRLAMDLGQEGRAPAALILESAFTSVPDMGRTAYPFLPVGLIARLEMDTEAYVRRSPCPVLVAHSPADEIVPVEQGRRVFAAAPEPKQFLELSGDHNYGFISSLPVYRQGVDGFLRDTAGL